MFGGLQDQRGLMLDEDLIGTAIGDISFVGGQKIVRQVEEETVAVYFVLSINSISHTVLSVSLKRNRDYKDQVVEHISKRYNKCGVDFNCFELLNDREQVVLGVPLLTSSQFYWFRLQHRIIPECASNWTGVKLQQLGITFKEVADVSKLFESFKDFANLQLSLEGQKLIDDHCNLTAKMIEDFRWNNNIIVPLNELAQIDSAVKTIFMVGK
jgi:hypothetical protein